MSDLAVEPEYEYRAVTRYGRVLVGVGALPPEILTILEREGQMYEAVIERRVKAGTWERLEG